MPDTGASDVSSADVVDVNSPCHVDQDVSGGRVLTRANDQYPYYTLVGASPAACILRATDNEGVARFISISRTDAGCTELVLPDSMTSITDLVHHADDSTYFGLGTSDLWSEAIYRQASALGPLEMFAQSLYSNGNPMHLDEVFGDNTHLYALRSPNEVVAVAADGEMTKLLDVTPTTIGSEPPRDFRIVGNRLVAFIHNAFNEAVAWDLESPQQTIRILLHSDSFQLVDIVGSDVIFVAEEALRKAAVGSDLSFGGDETILYSASTTRAVRVGAEYIVADAVQDTPSEPVQLRRVSAAGSATDLTDLRFVDCPVIEEGAAICRDAEDRWVEVQW